MCGICLDAPEHIKRTTFHIKLLNVQYLPWCTGTTNAVRWSFSLTSNLNIDRLLARRTWWDDAGCSPGAPDEMTQAAHKAPRMRWLLTRRAWWDGSGCSQGAPVEMIQAAHKAHLMRWRSLVTRRTKWDDAHLMRWSRLVTRCAWWDHAGCSQGAIDEITQAAHKARLMRRRRLLTRRAWWDDAGCSQGAPDEMTRSAHKAPDAVCSQAAHKARMRWHRLLTRRTGVG